MIRKLVLYLDDRLGAAPFLRHALRKAFPDHWSFMLGELAAYCFIFLVLTGTYLTFFFQASDSPVQYHGPISSLVGRWMSESYKSALDMSFGNKFGLVMRQAHHWAADLFVAAICVHMGRIFFTGAYRKPRELNWYIGITLLMIAMAEGFTGYSLPGDNLSGAGLRIAVGIGQSIPVIGTWLIYLFFHDTFPSDFVSSRLYPLHILLLPIAIAALVTIHVMILWHQKHSQFPGKKETEHNVVGSPLFPIYTVKSMALMFATFGVLFLMGGLIQINPIWEYGPYTPWVLSSPAQPDWYIGWLEGALRIAPRWAVRLGPHSIGAPFWPGIFMPLCLFAVLYAWPTIEFLFTRDKRDHQLLQFPWQNPSRVSFGVWVTFFVAILLGAGSDDVQAYLWHTPVQSLVWAYRVGVVVVPFLASAFAYRVCLELQARHEEDKPHRVVLRRSAEGGFEEERLPTP